MKTLYFLGLLFLLSACQPKSYEIIVIDSNQNVISSLEIQEGQLFNGINQFQDGYEFEGYYIDNLLIQLPYEVNENVTIEMRYRKLNALEMLSEKEQEVYELLQIYFNTENIAYSNVTTLVQISNIIVYTRDQDMYQDLGWRRSLMIQYIYLNQLQTVQIVFADYNEMIKVSNVTETSVFQSKDIDTNQLDEALKEFYN